MKMKNITKGDLMEKAGTFFIQNGKILFFAILKSGYEVLTHPQPNNSPKAIITRIAILTGKNLKDYYIMRLGQWLKTREEQYINMIEYSSEQSPETSSRSFLLETVEDNSHILVNMTGSKQTPCHEGIKPHVYTPQRLTACKFSTIGTSA